MKPRSNGHPRYCDCEGCERRKRIARTFGASSWAGVVYQQARREEQEAFERGRVTTGRTDGGA